MIVSVIQRTIPQQTWAFRINQKWTARAAAGQSSRRQRQSSADAHRRRRLNPAATGTDPVSDGVVSSSSSSSDGNTDKTGAAAVLRRRRGRHFFASWRRRRHQPDVVAHLPDGSSRLLLVNSQSLWLHCNLLIHTWQCRPWNQVARRSRVSGRGCWVYTIKEYPHSRLSWLTAFQRTWNISSYVIRVAQKVDGIGSLMITETLLCYPVMFDALRYNKVALSYSQQWMF